jgi:protein TonB
LYPASVQEPINLVVPDQKAQSGGLSLAVAFSIVFHAGLIVLFLATYKPAAPQAATPMMRYVDLIKQNPREFVEAPGRAVESAPLNAPWSDANRRAATPKPTGDKPTTRPGDGGGLYTPPAGSPGPAEQPQKGAQEAPREAQAAAEAASPVASTPSSLSSRMPALRTEASAAATGAVNWRSVVSDVKQVASIGGGEALDLSSATGGEEGKAETGQLSFETQWYNWGEYAQSMVSKIRVHWYDNMPMLIRTGLKGVVTIRFTIQRDGRITDVILLNSSGAPPYDFAAKKAIELASPLKPLPADFPKSTERVTAMFYYNRQAPAK